MTNGYYRYFRYDHNYDHNYDSYSKYFSHMLQIRFSNLNHYDYHTHYYILYKENIHLC